jgi:hypothetical protein
MMNTSQAPVVIFAYNRPEHLRNCLDSLLINHNSDKTELFVNIDGPRNEYDQEMNIQCVSVVSEYNSFKNIEIWQNETNFGLSRSVLTGTQRIFGIYSSAIFIEDDLIVSPYFLKFMNEGLNVYNSNSKVASIHGYQYPITDTLECPVFLRGADCWGWATWKDRWDGCQFDAKKLLQRIQYLGLADTFDLDKTIENTKMLSDNIDRKNDSWAIRWHAEMFLSEKYTIYPPRSLVQNMGSDGSGENSGISNIFDTKLSSEEFWNWPSEVVESQAFRSELKKLFIQVYQKNKSTRVKSFIIRMISIFNNLRMVKSVKRKF